MRVILLSDRPSAPREWRVSPRTGWLLPLLFLGSMLAAGLVGYRLALPQAGELPADVVGAWESELAGLQRRTHELQGDAGRDARAYAARMATLQARLLRMEAVGERLAVAAGFEGGEFDFGAAPALGGPRTAAGSDAAAAPATTLTRELDALAAQIEDRQRQLEVMERLLLNRRLAGEATLAGMPVASGYVSSRFGRRTDPFDGGTAWHKGVDFTARPGTEVFAVAAGVVLFAGRDADYGNLVAIRHSNGYVTRYAHNRDLLVRPGDIVSKGQAIARVGQTGRASGAHLHLEVLLDGRTVDPLRHISTVRGQG
ncbi:MAG: hypothetical protein CALGDGBN_02586 [Pseudomonadales bacterium]|nr:hypothetical protein [Pseudomonadales bacterium]